VNDVLNHCGCSKMLADCCLPEHVNLEVVLNVAHFVFLTRFVLLVVLPCIVAFFALRKFYVKTSREVKRIEGTARSPLYAHLSMTIDGLAIVRTFPGAASRFLTHFGHLHDEHTRSWFTFILTARWLGFRLDLIVSSLVLVASFSAVAQRDSIGAGGAGLSLAYIMQLTGTESPASSHFIGLLGCFLWQGVHRRSRRRLTPHAPRVQARFSGRCDNRPSWRTN
jgi:ATP-binding cassette subfamily C (CFTR/MRP) protein 4